MTKKVLKVTLEMIAIIILIGIMILAYYMIADIETRQPNGIESVCKLETKQFVGRKLFIVTPKENSNPQKTILYCHGGSYVAEATKEHWDFIERLVEDTGYRVVLPDYPLTPKYTYKDVFAMMVPLYKEIVDRMNPEDLIVMGDSAGGGLSLALLEKVSKDNEKMPGKTILISPWLDARLTNPKIDEVQKLDKQLNKETLKLAGIAYAGGEKETGNYLVSPIEGDLSKLKNVTIFTGTNDILNPDVYVLEERAEKVGVDIEIKEYEEARTYMDNKQQKQK